MKSLTEFFYDGRKILIALITFIIFIITFFIFKKEVVPYSAYLFVFSKYLGELNPMTFIIFYYSIVAYFYSSLLVSTHDLVTIIMRGGSRNV